MLQRKKDERWKERKKHKKEKKKEKGKGKKKGRKIKLLFVFFPNLFLPNNL